MTMQANLMRATAAAALDELIETGTLVDFTASGDDIERELAKVSEKGKVDSDLARLKSEVGT